MKKQLLLTAIFASFLAAPLAIGQEADTQKPDAAAAASGDTIASQFQDHLVKLEDGEVTDFNLENPAEKEYVALYYSAHWCPPCRAFTPSLSDFYKETAADKDANYELIFISSDRSADDMKGYMEWGDMKYPAVKFGERRTIPILGEHAPQGIPHLVVLNNKTGEVVANTMVNGQYAGPQQALDKLKELVK